MARFESIAQLSQPLLHTNTLHVPTIPLYSYGVITSAHIAKEYRKICMEVRVGFGLSRVGFAFEQGRVVEEYDNG